MIRHLCFLLLFWIPFTIEAQPHSYLLQHKLIGPDEGLLDRNIRHIFQDSVGYIWIKTYSGLYRYDGFSVSDYSYLIKNLRPGSSISSVEDQRTKKIYIYSIHEVFLFDPVHLKVSSVKKYGDQKIIKQVACSGDKIIVSFKSGLIHVYNAQFEDPVVINLGVKYDFQIGSIYVSSGQVLGIRSIEEVWVTWNYETGLLQKWNEDNIPVIENDNFNNYSGESIYLGAFYKPLGNSNFRYEVYLRNDKLVALRSAYAKGLLGRYNISAYDTISIYEDRLLLHGINYNKDYINELRSSYGADLSINLVSRSRDNTLFISMGFALIKVSLIPNYFNKFLDDTTVSLGQAGISIRGMAEDMYGKIWIGSYPHILNGHDAYHIYDPLKKGIESYQVLGLSGSMYRLQNMPGGRMLLLNEIGPLLDLSINSPKDIKGRAFAFFNQSMFDFYCWPDSTLWLGHDKGLTVSDLKSYTRGNVQLESIPALGRMRVNCFVPKDSNTMYLATAKGIYLMTRQKQILAHYYHGAEGDIVIPHGLIYHVNQVGDILWAASENGLIKISLTTGNVTQYQTKDGLPDNNVYCVIDDDQGNLWMSTNNGLCRFRPELGEFRNFGVEDGLPFKEFNNASYLKARDGTLYFGGLNGVVSVVPSQIIDDSTTNARMNIEYLTFLPSGELTLDSVPGINLPQHMVFRPGTSNINLKVMIPLYSRENKFRYRLKGELTSDWETVKNDNLLSFNYLPAGAYQVEVQPYVGGRGWADHNVSFGFTISKYWYNSWWFFIGLFLFSFGIIYLIYKYRLEQIKKIVRIRNRISADMHDEIGSTLSSISFYTQALLQNSENERDTEVLTTIQDNSQKVQDTLADIIWSIQPGMDELDQVVNRMRAFGNELTDSKQMKFHMEVEGAYDQVKLRMAARRNFYLIFKEAINNAVKYSQASKIWVYLEVYPHQFIKMSIKDDGQGFDPAVVNAGNGLNNMRRRAEELKASLQINSEPGAGCEVLLTMNIK